MMMSAWSARVERTVSSILARAAGGDEGIWGPAGGRWKFGVAVGVTAAAGLALAAAIVISSRRGGLRSPWSPRRRKHALTEQQFRSLCTPEGRFVDGGVRFLKMVRSGGIDPSIRAEAWPFLLGVYYLDTSEADRNEIRAKKSAG